MRSTVNFRVQSLVSWERPIDFIIIIIYECLKLLKFFSLLIPIGRSLYIFAAGKQNDCLQWRSQDFSEWEAIVTTQLYGGPGACSPGNVLEFGSLKRHFLHFEGTFEQNIYV